MKWLWVCYPVIVLIVIITASNFLLGSGGNYFENVQAKQQKAAEMEKKLNQLNKKLSQLNAADDNKMQDDLKMLLEVMPARRDIWSLLTELNMAASGSGAKLESYKGTVGDVGEAEAATMSSKAKPVNTNDPIMLKVTYSIKKFDDLTSILKNLDTSLPLIKVTGIDFIKDKADISIEAAWAPWEKTNAAVESDLPVNYQNTVESIRKSTLDFKKPDINTIDTTISPMTSPF